MSNPTGPRNLSQEAAATNTKVNGLIERKAFYFAAAAAEGDLCVVDRASTTYGLGNSAKTSPAGTDDNPEVVGVVERAVVAATIAEIVTYGPVRVKANANLDAGDPVCGDTAAAGTVREYVEGTDGNRVGFALEADGASNPDDGGATEAGYARIFVQLK